MREGGAKARELDKSALGQLISIFEDLRPQTAATRSALEGDLAELPSRNGIVLGFTGTPGAGKSTLIGQLALRLIERKPNSGAAAIAVDPSSLISQSALLGDRTRVRFPPGERRLFFPSQSSRLHTGGLSPVTYPVTNLLSKFFDFVFLETVGT